MGLGRAFARSVAPTSARQFGTGFGNLIQSTGGKPWEVSGYSGLELYRGALSLPGAWRGCNLMGDLLAQVPWDAWTEHGREQEELISPRPLLLEQPAPPDTRFTTFKSMFLDYLWHGNAVGIIATRDGAGKPTSIWPVPAPWVGVRRITDRTSSSTFLPIGAIEYNIAGKVYSANDVVHVKGPCAPGALRGFGVLEAHLLGTLATSHEQQHEAQKMARHGVPPGYLRATDPDVTDDELREARDDWMSKRDAGGVAGLNSQIEFHEVAWNPDEMQMIEAREFTLLEMANLLGLPPSFLGAAVAGTSLTYSTVDTEALGLLKFSMGGHFSQFEQTLSLAFPRGTCVRANLDHFLRADTLTRYNAYAAGIDAGWLLRSEVRAEERLKLVKGIDEQPLPKKAEVGLLKSDPEAPTVAQVPAPGAAPIQAQANRVPELPSLTDEVGARVMAAYLDLDAEVRSESNLEHSEQGHELYEYYLDGEGSAWKASPKPWTTLRDLLLKNAKGRLDDDEAAGLAANLFMDVFHMTPQEHAKLTSPSNGNKRPALLGRKGHH